MENQLKKSEQSPIIMDIDKKPYWGQVGVTETQTRPVHAHGVVINGRMILATKFSPEQ